MIGHGDFAIGSDIWPGTSKLIEESGELLQVLGKLMATSGDLSFAGRAGRSPKARSLSHFMAAPRTAPETLSVVLDTWLHRYLGKRDSSISLEELIRSNRLRDTYTLTEAS